jgi:hypothetical protein
VRDEELLNALEGIYDAQERIYDVLVTVDRRLAYLERVVSVALEHPLVGRWFRNVPRVVPTEPPTRGRSSGRSTPAESPPESGRPTAG